MKLDPFYLIVDSADWIERLVPLGVKLVQLRIKQGDISHLRKEIRASKAVCEAHGCTLVINDHWRLAIDEGCDFVHLGQEDLAEADLPTIRKNALKLGLSTHDPAELENALRARPDYVALGPIYPTVLKAMKWAPQGLARLADWKQQVADVPLVAIGGFTVDRAAGAFAMGAQSVAVVTDVIANAKPERRVAEWLEKTATWR